MNTKNIPSGKLKENAKTADTEKQPSQEVEELRAQMLELQMEIDILKETINILKKA